MKVIYKDPNDNIKYTRWFDDDGVHNIWYTESTKIYYYEEMDLPEELKLFLAKWNEKILKYKETYKELYPVKLAHIEFIYKDVLYSLYPLAVSASYETSFMSDEPYTVSWDSLFETYQREIRDDLKKELNVIHSRYYGFLD